MIGKHNRLMLNTAFTVCIALVISLMKPVSKTYAGTVIDDSTVIRTDQLGSIAGHAGDYGWDSRGAVFRYYDESGKISGDLGTILFCDESGTPRDRMWAAWGNEFPDWWGRMLAERVRNNTGPDKMKYLRQAFANSVTFECTWVIAIGIKDNSVGSGPVLTLRVDDTLRNAYNVDTSGLDPAEKLYAGDDMTGSLSDLIAGEQWGKTSQRTFEERNPYIYRVAIDSYAINMYATDCITCAKAGKINGEYCEHNNRRLMLTIVPIEYGGKAYTGDMSFVWQGQIANYREPVISGYRRNPSQDDLSGFYGRIGNGSIAVERDSVLYFAYESVNPAPTATPQVTGPTPAPGPSGLTPTQDIPGTLTPTPVQSEPGSSTGSPGQGETPIPSGPTSTPRPTPTPGPVYDPIPEGGAQTVYGANTLDTMDTFAKARICSDVFDVRTAVPSTESVYIKASARDIMYRMNVRTVSGKMPISVTVGVPYILRWSDDEGNEFEESGVSETSTVVYRDYSYLHLDSLEFYTMENIVIANPAISPDRIELRPEDLGVIMPVVSQPVVYGSGIPSFKGNIDYPSGFEPYILSSEVKIVTGDTNKPAIPEVSAEEAYWTAENAVGELLCRNDEFTVDSHDVLGTSGWHVYGSGSLDIDMPWPDIVEFDTSVMYGADHITIPASKRNGMYRTTTRLIRYRTAASYGTPGSPYDALIEVNPVYVHTPVYGEAFIEECDTSTPNGYYFQETGENPGEAFIIVNGASNSPGAAGYEHDTEDFFIRFSNTGSHPVYTAKLSSSYNYFENINDRNGGTYIEGNYLKFPFDVYMDVGNDGSSDNDRLIKKDVWVRTAVIQRFYPVGPVPGGYYDIEAETVAVNAYGTDDRSEDIPLRVNSDPDDYIVGNRIRVYITGKLYGLSLIDISSKAEWGDVFTYDRLNKYIRDIPETSSGTSWPANDGTMRSLSSRGLYGENEIASGIFYYTAGTKNELGKDTGRHEKYTFPLMAGSHPDMTGLNRGVLKPGYRWRFRVKTAGYTMGLAGSRLLIEYSFRIMSGEYEGYGAEIYVPDARGTLKKMIGTIDAVRVASTASGLQVWNFEFRIPEGSRIAVKGKPVTVRGRTYDNVESYFSANGLIDPGDDIWLEEGVIAVNFRIYTLSPDGSRLYSYDPENGNGNMWKIEGQNTDKADFYGYRYRLSYGDIALVSIEKGANSDYQVDHQN